MEVEFLGANCFRIKTKKTTLVIDDNLSKIGGKSVQSEKTAGFYTSDSTMDESAAEKSRLTITTPGEFEVGDVTVTGTQTRGHMDEDDKQTATVYQFMEGGQTITVLGHVHPDISPEVSELIGGTDVLVLPVGGNGFTLDPTGATSIIKKVEPGIVIPSQYEIDGLKYEVPGQPLEEFLKVASINAEEPQDSLKLSKNVDDSSTQTKLVILNVLKK